MSDSDFDRTDSNGVGNTTSADATTQGAAASSAIGGDSADTTLANPNRGQESSAINLDDVQKRSAVRQPANRDLNSAKKTDRNSSSATEVVHQTAPYNLQSLRDLYSQVPEQVSKVRRFGSDMFLDRGLTTRQMSIDVPIGPDYILGAGDGLIINLWGGISQSFARTVDREGKIALSEAGTIVVAGLSLERAQA